MPFVSTAGVITGMSVTGANIPLAEPRLQRHADVGDVEPAAHRRRAGSTPIIFTAPTLARRARRAARSARRPAASCANLETPLPLIDIVNECLEYMARGAPRARDGTVYDTSPMTSWRATSCASTSRAPRTTRQPLPRAGAALRRAARVLDPGRPRSPPTPPSSRPSSNKLKADFSSCRLPYSQALDVSRTYLRHFGSCRFEEMRTFRKCITEFVLDPANEPAGFADYLWRYPVRIDIAIEYLGITPEEYALLFARRAPRRLAPYWSTDDADRQPPRPRSATGGPSAARSASPSPGDGDTRWIATVVRLPEFLAPHLPEPTASSTSCGSRASSRFRQQPTTRATARSRNASRAAWTTLSLRFPRGASRRRSAAAAARSSSGCGASCEDRAASAIPSRSCATSATCCSCSPAARLNPDFIRQLAAFQMLRDHFRLELADPHDRPAAARDRRRPHAAAGALGRPGGDEVGLGGRAQLLRASVVQHAQRRRCCEHRPASSSSGLASNLDPLSRLAGFDPASATDTWHALPTHTLRFAEMLAKIYASRLPRRRAALPVHRRRRIPDGDDPFPLQDENEALELAARPARRRSASSRSGICAANCWRRR